VTRKFDYCSFRKDERYCVDGFAKDSAASIVVVPAVMRERFPFNGIKPAVLILQENFVTKEIKDSIKESELQADNYSSQTAKKRKRILGTTPYNSKRCRSLDPVNNSYEGEEAVSLVILDVDL